MVAARLLLFLLGLLSATNTARAYEDEFGIAAAAGYSLARGHGRNLQGVSVGTILDYGLAEYWSIRARLDYAFFPGTGLDPNIHNATLGTEFIYSVDVVTLVPFAGAGLDVRGWHERSETDLLPAAHAVLGVDYLASRDWIFGVDVRGFVTPDPSQGRPFQLLAVAVIRYLLDY